MADSHTLPRRLQRLRQVFHETRSKRGWIAAITLLVRQLLLKTPRLITHLWAARRTAAIRASIAHNRYETPDNPYVAVLISGGLGDTVVIARFVRDLAAHVGKIRFDVFSPIPAQAAWVFDNIPGFHAAYHDIVFDHTVAEYDLAMRVSQSVVVYQEYIRWASVRHNPNLMQVIDSLIRYRPKIDVFVDRHPWLDHLLARTAVFEGATRRDFLHLIANLCYGGEQLPVPRDTSVVSRFGLHPGRYITVHNGFDPGYIISSRRATKCYPHFGAVVTLVKSSLPNVPLVQIGTTTSDPIKECDLILLNKTSLSEVAGLLSQAILHIDNEGGLVHLAASLGVQSAVVFGPTPSDYFGYADNINIEPPVCGNCWYMTRTWMDACAKGYKAPLCMTEQDPRAVSELVLAALQDETSLAQPDEPHVETNAPDRITSVEDVAT